MVIWFGRKGVVRGSLFFFTYNYCFLSNSFINILKPMNAKPMYIAKFLTLSNRFSFSIYISFS